MPDPKSAKTTVTMIQDDNGQCKAVRIGGVEIPVLTGAPIPGLGCMNFSLTIADVEVAYARAEPVTDA